MSNAALRKKLNKEIDRLRADRDLVKVQLVECQQMLGETVETLDGLRKFLPDPDLEGQVPRVQALAALCSDLGWDSEAAALASTIGLMVKHAENPT